MSTYEEVSASEFLVTYISKDGDVTYNKNVVDPLTIWLNNKVVGCSTIDDRYAIYKEGGLWVCANVNVKYNAYIEISLEKEYFETEEVAIMYGYSLI